jgi:hypothetical protein
MDGSDPQISMTSVRVFLPRVEWTNSTARSCQPPIPLLCTTAYPIHVLCQTQHLRHFLRGRLSSPFLSSLSPDLRSPQDMSISNPLAWVRNPFNPSSQFRSLSPRRIRASMVRRRIVFPPSYHKCPLQFRKGSTHRRIRCDQEDHEALQHACPLETHLSRAETSQAHPTRKRPSPLTSSTLFPPYQFPLSPDHQP